MRTTLDRLADLADAHGGYFTTGEAAEAGLSRRLLSHHATAGALERVDHGIYRLRLYPRPRFEDLIVTALWAGADSAISHESALVVYGLGEAMPPVVHVTVPRPFRGRRPGVILHHRPLTEDERVVVDAVPVTSVERTLTDVAGSSDPALVRAAAHEALDRGLTTRLRLERSVSDPGTRKLLLGTTRPTRMPVPSGWRWRNASGDRPVQPVALSTGFARRLPRNGCWPGSSPGWTTDTRTTACRTTSRSGWPRATSRHSRRSKKTFPSP